MNKLNNHTQIYVVKITFSICGGDSINICRACKNQVTRKKYSLSCDMADLRHAAAACHVEQKAGDDGFYCPGFN